VCSVPQSEMVPSSPASSPAACISWAKSWPRLQAGTPDTIPARQHLSPTCHSAMCRSTFERAGGREVKQMDSAYSACLLVSW